jgi:5-methylcytosine-specific restriction endonuclease McrA
MRADHIDPIVPVTGFDNWDALIGRLFCELDGFQAICVECHAAKTKEENAERKKNKEKA